MRNLLAGAAALAMMTGAVEAADILQPLEPISPAPEVTVEEEATGWYLRGDVGYSFNKLRGVSSLGGWADPNNANSYRFDKVSAKDSAVLGIGVGYKINSYLRTDVTLDHLFKSKFKGHLVHPDSLGNPVQVNSRSSVKGWGLLANAYVDLGTFSGITPYIGAGIGGTHVKWNTVHTTGTHGGGPVETGDQRGQKNWRFTYALMAGASVDVTCNVKADLGYRFRHITGGDMFGFNKVGPGKDKGFYNHEIRVGARYQFGGCDKGVAYAPEPVDLPVYK